MPDATAGPAKTTAPQEAKSSFREICETVVFVVMLVLMLKLFVVEAFVIPTGSMAETLWGHQKRFTCDQCKHPFPVNAADEVEPANPANRREIVGYTCPNCGFFTASDDPARQTPLKVPGPGSGDRVVVLKPRYHVADPRRWDVPVFKYPQSPQNDQTPTNYIKRLIGLPGETVALCGGNLYVSEAIAYPESERNEFNEPKYPRPDAATELWNLQYTYPQSYDEEAVLTEKRFRVLRKPPAKMLAMARLVYDNAHQPLAQAGRPRWSPEAAGAWTADAADFPKTFSTQSGELSWLRYRHLVPDWNNDPRRAEPHLITNGMGYNSYRFLRPPPPPGQKPLPLQAEAGNDQSHWVGDLMLECTVTLGAGQTECVLELSKGVDRFQARFNTVDGKCSYVRVRPTGEELLVAVPAGVTGPGTYRLRLANFDDEMTVWVNGRVLDAGEGARYSPVPPPLQYESDDSDRAGWTKANDIERPARVGLRGEATVTGLRLLRDTYYVSSRRVTTYYVQPGHYFCLGDNSAYSADGRMWGLVPERLLLGRALLVYWPLSRMGFIE